MVGGRVKAEARVMLRLNVKEEVKSDGEERGVMWSGSGVRR